MFGENNQTLVYEWTADCETDSCAIDLQNGVICRASLLEHDNLAGR